jgi:putative Holliday junction resolvase
VCAAQYRDHAHDNNTKSFTSLSLAMSPTADSKGGGILPLDAFAGALPRGTRLIGIDVGSKTLGLALSDATRNIASGLVTLRRSRLTADLHRLLDLAAEHGVCGFVVGLPLNLDGSEGPRAQATRAFVRNLAKVTTLPIVYWDERLSTAAAERVLLEADTSRRRRAAVVDKVAATLILQTALDRMNYASRTETRRGSPL